jgi:hypothetical protein
VYLVPKPSIRSSADLKDAMFIDLGGLRAFKGSQRYVIPDGVNLKDYQSVIQNAKALALERRSRSDLESRIRGTPFARYGTHLRLNSARRCIAQQELNPCDANSLPFLGGVSHK